MLLVSLNLCHVISDSLPRVELSKYVQKDEFTTQMARLQESDREQKDALTEIHGTVDSLRSDLLETRNLLAQALLKVSTSLSAIEGGVVVRLLTLILPTYLVLCLLLVLLFD